MILVAVWGMCEAGEEVTLIVSRWASSPPQDMVDELFMEQNPDIKIEVFAQTGGLQLAEAGGEGLMVQLVSGEIPDVAVMADATIGKFAAARALTDLGPYLERSNIERDVIWDTAWDAVTYDGKVQGVPYVTDTRALVYNKRLFAEAGIDRAPSRLSELDATAQKLTEKDSSGNYKTFGFWPRWGNWWLWGWGWLFGGRFYDAATHTITANDPRIVKALEYEVSYVLRYDAPAGNFAANTLGMEITVSTALPYYNREDVDVDYGIVPPPPPEEGKPATWSGIWVWAMPRNAPHADAAWKYLQFLLGPEAQRIKAREQGEIPTNREANKYLVGDYVERYGDAAKVFLEITDRTHVRPITPVSNEYWNELEKARDTAYKLQKTPQQALDDVTEIVQARLDEMLAKYE